MLTSDRRAAVANAIEKLRDASYTLDIIGNGEHGRLARSASSARNKVVDALHQMERALEATQR